MCIAVGGRSLGAGGSAGSSVEGERVEKATLSGASRRRHYGAFLAEFLEAVLG